MRTQSVDFSLWIATINNLELFLLKNKKTK